MAENDPYFDGRFMEQGTTGAEFIYNEFLGRSMASGYRVLSRTTLTPPATPATFDSYLIPTAGPATGDWAGLEGQIVFWLNKWYPISPKPGMHVYVVDEQTWLDFPTSLETQAQARDGDLVLQPVFTTSWEATWNAAQGTAARLTLENNVVLREPINMAPGRFYVLRVTQANGGSHDLTMEHQKWANLTSNGTLPISATDGSTSDIYIMGPLAPWNVPTVYLVNANVQQVSTM